MATEHSVELLRKKEKHAKKLEKRLAKILSKTEALRDNVRDLGESADELAARMETLVAQTHGSNGREHETPDGR